MDTPISIGSSKIDIDLYRDLLAVDSTSGKERKLAEWLSSRLAQGSACTVRKMEVGDGTLNLQLSWGTPRVFFCTHLDTVPPYISPAFEPTPGGDTLVKGRGSCDAKGQIMAMYTACRELEREGLSGFALLLLSGEETGSHGAKAYAKSQPGGDWVIVGEPTDGKMVAASKGTKAYDITITGKSCHSGYPEQGINAIELFLDFANQLRATPFPVDPVMGATTYNMGRLESDNPQNVLSDKVHLRLYFRTTQASDAMVEATLAGMASEHIHIEALGGDTPMSYSTLEGFDTTTVAFGSDAPRLYNFKHRALCGPGSILVAHQPGEQVLLSEVARAASHYVAMYKQIAASSCD